MNNQLEFQKWGRYYRIKSKYAKYIIPFIDLIGTTLFFLKKKKEFKKEKIKKILIIRLDHLGDLVLTTSFIKNVKQNFPNSEITLLCRKKSEGLIKSIEGLDKVNYINSPWFCKEEKCESWLFLFSWMIKNWKYYDLAFDLHGDPRNIFLGANCSKYLVGFGNRGLGFLLNKEISYKGIKHIVLRQLDLLKSLDLKIFSEKLVLKKDKIYLEKVKKILKKKEIPKEFLLIQISSNNRTRELDLESWIKFIKKKNKTETIVCAEPNEQIKNYLMSKIKSKRLIFLKLNLSEYIHLIALSQKVYSVESLAIHVATAFNVSVIDFHSGTTYSEEWGPFGEKVKIIQDKSCKYYPCGLDVCKYGFPSKCMSNLKIENV